MLKETLKVRCSTLANFPLKGNVLEMATLFALRTELITCKGRIVKGEHPVSGTPGHSLF